MKSRNSTAVNPRLNAVALMKSSTFLMLCLTEDGAYSKTKGFRQRIGERLICLKDNRSEALECDTYAIGVYKKVEEPDEKLKLVGHVSIECSSLLD